MQGKPSRNIIALDEPLMGLVLSGAVFSGSCFADVSTAMIRGQISLNSASGNGGAQVIAVNQERGISTRTFSREDGSYVLMALKPGRYQIKLLAPDGQQSVQEMIVQVGQIATLNLEVGANLTEAGREDERAVTDKSSEVATYVTPEQMQRLPQVNRNFLNYADLAPGVNVVTDTAGSIRLQSGGQRPDSVNVYIDGVGQKNYVVRGGAAGQDSSRGNIFPESAVSEYKVLTQNYKAEFDQISGAAISVLTKSGTNDFHGQAFYDHTNQDLRSATPTEVAEGGKRDSEQVQYGVTLSGPIAKDVAHFFTAYEKKHNDESLSVETGDHSALPPQYRSLLSKAKRPFDEDLFFGKFDWSLNEDNLLEVSFKLREETETVGVGGQNAQSYGLDKGNSEKRLDVKYQYTGEHWVNEARLTYEDANWRQSPAMNGPGLILQRADGSGVLNTGGGTNFQDKGQNGPALQNDLTLSDMSWQGDHIVKLGGKVKMVDLKALERDPYNPQFNFNLNHPDGTPYRVRWGAPLAPGKDGATSSDVTQVGLYVQDDWDINKNLTLNLGARWDYEDNPAYTDFVTPDDAASAMRNWTNISRGKGGYDIENYISNGSNRSNDSNNIAPRLGFAYDMAQDQRHVLFGGYARAYDRNIYDVLQLERTKGTFPAYTVNFAGDADHDCGAEPICIAWNPAYLSYTPQQLAALAGNPASDLREINLINNHLKTPYSDQFSLGMRNRIGDWHTELVFSHIHSREGIVGLRGGRNPDGSFSSFGATPNLPGFGQLILFDNAVETKTNAIFVKAEMPYSKNRGWGMTLAYTYTDSMENKPQSFVDSSSYLLDVPNTRAVGWLDTAGVRAHKLVATGTVDLPWDLVFSTKLTLATPETQSGVNCLEGPCRFDTFTPKGNSFILPGDWWGYRQVDIAVIKSFDTPHSSRFKLRLDILNLLDFKNYAAYNNNFSSANFGQPLDLLAGPSLTVKFTARLEF